NALLVPPKNPDAIAIAIERMIKNPDLYEQLSRKGRLFVEQNISWRKYAEYMLKVFEEVIKRNKGIPRHMNSSGSSHIR
ncbi:MAG: hypothetical protein Q8R40_05490, partial [bacterium]|nr:hypothetical protein [bacterium]